MSRTLPIVVVALAPFLFGCGGRVDAGSGGAPANGGSVAGGAGGGGGVPTGGTAGTGPEPCASCPEWKLGGLLSVPACCAGGTQCGAALSSMLGDILVIPPGCYALGQPGTPDPACPPLDYVSPLDGMPYQYPGCCRAASGTCGVILDFAEKQGPTLGCADVSPGGPAQTCGGAPSCDACVQTSCADELEQCFADFDCSAMVNCMANCSDGPCLQKCYAQYPAAQWKYDMVDTCVHAKCGAFCG